MECCIDILQQGRFASKLQGHLGRKAVSGKRKGTPSKGWLLSCISWRAGPLHISIGSSLLKELDDSPKFPWTQKCVLPSLFSKQTICNERLQFTQGHIWEKVLQQEPAKLGVNIIVLPEWWLVSGSLKGWVQIVKYLRCLAGMTGVYIWGRGEESSKQRNKMKKKICRQLNLEVV